MLIPDVVEAELRHGAGQHSHLKAVLDADWIEVVSLDTPEQCGVLALAETTANAVAVVDDRVAGLVAKSRNVEVRRTLGLLCEAIHQGLLTVPLVSALADDLLENSYRLPFGPGGFARWAADEGLT